MYDAVNQNRPHDVRWAAKGSRHDVIVRLAGFSLPIFAGALAGILMVAPMINRNDVSFVLAQKNVAVAKERMRLTRALYRGVDSKGQAFQLRAGSAVQASSKDPVVRMVDLAAQVTLPEGPATMRASNGSYDMDSEIVTIAGPVGVHTNDGYTMNTRDVDMNLRTRQLASRGPVDGQLALGSFSAQRLHADLSQRTLILDGRAHLHIVQRIGRGANG